MKNIIAAFDGLKFSESTNKYAIEIARHSNTHLGGIFLDDFTYHSYKIYDLINDKGVSDLKLTQLEDKDSKAREESVKKFEIACQKHPLIIRCITISPLHCRNCCTKVFMQI